MLDSNNFNLEKQIIETKEANSKNCCYSQNQLYQFALLLFQFQSTSLLFL